MLKKKVITLMQEVFDSMHRSGLIPDKVSANDGTILLGSDLTLDSLGFVTFISDLEERISTETGKDFFIVLSDIHESNIDGTSLTIGELALYIENLTELQ